MGLHQDRVSSKSHWFYKKIKWHEPLKVAADHTDLTNCIFHRVGHNERGKIKDIFCGFAFDGDPDDTTITITRIKRSHPAATADWAALVALADTIATVDLAGTEGHGVATKMTLTQANAELQYGDILLVTTAETVDYEFKKGFFIEIRYRPYDDAYNALHHQIT